MSYSDRKSPEEFKINSVLQLVGKGELSVSKAALQLGLSTYNVNKLMKEYGITKQSMTVTRSDYNKVVDALKRSQRDYNQLGKELEATAAAYMHNINTIFILKGIIFALVLTLIITVGFLTWSRM